MPNHVLRQTLTLERAMLNALKNRTLIKKYLKCPPFKTYFEARLVDNPECVVRVSTNRPGPKQWTVIDPVTRTIEQRSLKFSELEAQELTPEKCLAFAHYLRAKPLIRHHVEYLYDLAVMGGMCYPVNTDNQGQPWYICPYSRYETGENWRITLWSPLGDRHRLVEWDHGPFDWNFYSHGHVDQCIHDDRWVAYRVLKAKQADSPIL